MRHDGKTITFFAKIGDIAGASINVAKTWHCLLLKDFFIEKVQLRCMICCCAKHMVGGCPLCFARKWSVTWGQRAERVVRQTGKWRGKYSRGKMYRSVTALGRYYALLSYIRLIDPDFGVYTGTLMVSSKLDWKRKDAIVGELRGSCTRIFSS